MKTSNTHYDVIIIGGGPAGYASALYTSRAGLTTLVLEQLFAGGQMSTTDQVENYPGFEETTPGLDLALKMEAGARRFGAVSLQAKATAIDPQKTPKRVETDHGSFTCGALILAMGADPRKLDLPGEDKLTGRGISYCATCDGALFRGQTVAVYGGGNSAVTEALSLAAAADRVYLIYRNNQLKAEQKLINQVMHTENLTLIPGTAITALHSSASSSALSAKQSPQAGQTVPAEQAHLAELGPQAGSAAPLRLTGLDLTHNKTGQIRRLDVDGLFVAIGRIPNTTLCQGILTLTEDGYIQADETTATTLPGVYAAGDLRTKPLRQIITAASDGAVAAVMAEEFLHRSRN